MILGLQRVLVGGESKQTRQLAIATFGLHQLLALYLLVQHELWRDELQAWSIAKASTSPLDVIRNTQFEGRPPLWQLLLWPLTRLFDNPNAFYSQSSKWKPDFNLKPVDPKEFQR